MRSASILGALAALAVLLLAPCANAKLTSVDGGLAVYDSTLNITWLADANLAATDSFGISGINPDGSMSWTTAQSWVAALNNANYLGVSYWRLPNTITSDPTCSGANGYGTGCTASEMAHLFNVDGIPGGSAQHLFNHGPIGTFWSGTQAIGLVCGNGPCSSPYYYTFSFSSGTEYFGAPASPGFAWIVARGDIAPVPEPSTAWLLAVGLIGVWWGVRLRNPV